MKLKQTYRKFILLFTAVFLCTVSAAFVPAAARAEEPLTAKTDIELPSSYLEYRELDAPRDVYHDDEVTAIIEGAENNKTLTVFYENAFSCTELQNAAQIARLGDYLVYQQDSSFFAYSLENGVSAQITDSNGSVITGSYFCMNRKYFLVFSTNLIKLYTFDAETLIFTNTDKTITANATSNPIAINENNLLFYFNDGKLYRRNVEIDVSPELCEGTYTATTDSRMIADDRYLFISSSNGVYRLNVNGKEEAVLILEKKSAETDISDLTSPTGLAFRNGNVLVCDTACDKIVEFGYDEAEQGYRYSGFAITTTANAANRLTPVTSVISLYREDLAILSDFAITLNENGNYRQVQLESLQLNYTPTQLVIGAKYICLANLRNLTFIDRATLAAVNCDATDMRPSAVSYSNGFYYVLSDSAVYSFDEETLTPARITDRSRYSSDDTVAADVDGNIYVCNNSEVTKYANGIEQNYKYYFSSRPLDIGVDLNGNVYALLSGNRIEYYKDGVRKTRTLELHEQNLPAAPEATAMAMNFDNDKIYFLFNGHGLILSTTDAENDSVTNVSVPEDFTLTGVGVEEPETFETVTPATGKNLFLVSETAEAGGKFQYLSLAHADGKEYVYGGETQGFYILLGEETALVKKSDAQKESGYVAAEGARAYAATAVNMYYRPVLTADGRYALALSERLPAQREITVYGKVSVNGREFYYAADGETKGYVPADFVTFELSEMPQTDEYAPQVLDAGKKGVTVYADQALSAAAETLYENTEVKAYATDAENVFYVEYTRADGTTGSGYVSGDSFLIKGRHAVRNAVIIILVSLSVAATSFYFINRKIKNKS